MSSDEDAHVRYIVHTKHNGKAHTKTPHGREQCQVNEYTFRHLRGQAKWPRDAPIWLPL